MNAPVFEASRMRTQRATKFIDELKDELRKYAKSETLTASVKFTDNCEPQITLSWPGVGLNPGAILGDCIHNMRTAFDLMASELARLNQQNDKNVYFPFAASIDDFPDAIKNSLGAFKILTQQLVKSMSRAVPVQDFSWPIVEHRLHTFNLAP